MWSDAEPAARPTDEPDGDAGAGCTYGVLLTVAVALALYGAMSVVLDILAILGWR